MSKRESRLFSLLAAALVGLAGSAASGQELTTASIVGVVEDASGGIIGGATITITSMTTGAERTITSGANGQFSAPGLAVGTYQVLAENSGFSPYLIEGVDLRLNQVLRLTIRMNVGAVTETVTVSADAVVLETDTGSLGQVIDQRKISELPLNGRDITTLVALSAGISPKSPLRGTQFGGRNQYVTIEGGRDSSTNFQVDGVTVRSLRFNNLSVKLNIDTVQEFKVNRNSFSAEYGQGQSAVAIATKSGGNDFHGTLFEFHRNDNLDARNFFDGVKPEFRRNQFGGSAGGPIVKNKLFIFGGYEGMETERGETNLGNVPNPALFSGDLSSIGTPVIDYQTDSPFPNNVIPQDRISQFGRVAPGFFPAPNRQGANNFQNVAGLSEDFNTFLWRADWNQSDKHQVFGRYIWYESDLNDPGTFTDTTFPQKGQNATIHSTITVTPRDINEFKVGYNRAVHFVLPVNPGGNPVEELGIRNLDGAITPFLFGVPNINVVGFSNPGNGGNTQGAVENAYSIADNFSMVRGNHTIKVGVEVQHRRFQHLADNNSRGTFNFNGQFSGSSIADFLLGTPNLASGALGSSLSNYRSNFVGAFIQDDWRVNSRLTLNLGLRWELSQPWEEQNFQEGFLDPETGLVVFTRVPPNVPPSLEGSFDPTRTANRGITVTDKNNFSPRIGIAYRPFGENTVIRTGFGIYYDNLNLNELQFTRLIAPLVNRFTLVADSSRPNIFTDNLFPDIGDIDRFPAPFSSFPDNRTPYSVQWNFNIQHSFARNWVVEAAYSGSSSAKLWKRFNQNQATFDPTNSIPIAERLPFPGIDPAVLTSGADAHGSFHGLTLKVEKSYSSGLFLLSSYTYSKAIDNNSGEIEANQTRDRTNKDLDRGRSRFDQPHRFVSSFGYQLPFGDGRRFGGGSGGVGGFLISGWDFQGILSLMTGSPFTVNAANVHNTGSFVPQLANRIGKGTLEDSSPERFFDLDAFTQPAVGTQGNAARNILDGPGISQFDFSIIKNSNITEQLRLQFRAEFFNLFNRTNFGLPNSNISSAAAGTIASADAGRGIQFGLKFIW